MTCTGSSCFPVSFRTALGILKCSVFRAQGLGAGRERTGVGYIELFWSETFLRILFLVCSIKRTGLKQTSTPPTLSLRV